MWPVHEHQNINKRPERRINAIYRSAKKDLASRNTLHWSNYNWDNNIANFRFIIMIWSLIDWSKLRPYFAKTLWYEAFGWLIYLDAFINSAWDILWAANALLTSQMSRTSHSCANLNLCNINKVQHVKKGDSIFLCYLMSQLHVKYYQIYPCSLASVDNAGKNSLEPCSTEVA